MNAEEAGQFYAEALSSGFIKEDSVTFTAYGERRSKSGPSVVRWRWGYAMCADYLVSLGAGGSAHAHAG